MHPKRLENPDARCPGHKDQRFAQVFKLAWEAGWWLEVSRKNYIKCLPPDVEMSGFSVPSTPSGSQTFKNYRAFFRQRGLDC